MQILNVIYETQIMGDYAKLKSVYVYLYEFDKNI